MLFYHVYECLFKKKNKNVGTKGLILSTLQSTSTLIFGNEQWESLVYCVSNCLVSCLLSCDMKCFRNGTVKELILHKGISLMKTVSTMTYQRTSSLVAKWIKVFIASSFMCITSMPVMESNNLRLFPYLSLYLAGIQEFPENIKNCKVLTVVEASVNPISK